MMEWDKFSPKMITAVIYVLIGLFIFIATFLTIVKVVPFSVRKEIEEDQNSALAIIIGSMIVGLAIIIGAAIHGG